MKHVRQLLALLMAALCPCLLPAASFAEEAAAGTGEPASADAAAEPAPAAAAEKTEDTGIIDAAELDRWMENFAAENKHDQAGRIFSVGFWYSGTGDSWYWNADEFMYSASLYKVPCAMLLAEKEAAGELKADSVLNGTTLEFNESTSLIWSNNDSGHNMVFYLGGTLGDKCSTMAEKFADLPEDYYTDNFRDYSYYSARFMTQVMRTLYLGGDEAFPRLIDYLKQAQPEEYFNRDANVRQYDVAQKFGAYTEPNGNANNHCTAIIYTPTPIVVTVMTRNVVDYQDEIAAVGAHLAEYALSLDQKLNDWRREEEERAAVEAAAAAEAARAAELSAQEAQTAENTGTGSDGSTGTSAAEPAGSNAGSGKTAGALSGVPKWLIGAIIALVVLILVCAVLLLLRKRVEMENQATEEMGAWMSEEAEEASEEERPQPKEKKPAPGKTESPARRPGSSGKTGSGGGYRPRH